MLRWVTTEVWSRFSHNPIGNCWITAWVTRIFEIARVACPGSCLMEETWRCQEY